MNTSKENEILDMLSSIASMIEDFNNNNILMKKELSELNKIVKHHDTLLSNLQIEKLPIDEQKEILDRLHSIEINLKETKSNNTNLVINSVLFIYVTLIGLYSYFKG